MVRTTLFTGFPGFIGRRLVAKLLQEDPSSQLLCLVQPKYFAQARVEAERVMGRLGVEPRRLGLQQGDITDPELGLDTAAYGELASRVTEVWHLAAIYDLAVAEKIARRINVDGTRNVLAFCRSCRSFTRLVYFSTCYVSGDRRGVVREEELAAGQGFKNHYESTKFAAEVAVRGDIERGLPGIVIRPSIVVGDAKTGETDKFDGPYNAFKMLSKLRLLPMKLPRLGPSQAEVNLIPVDFLVDATVAIAKDEASIGKTFHIADPAPLKAADIYDLACRLVTGRGAARISLPAGWFDAALSLRPVRGFFDVPREVLTYFNHDVHYDTSNTSRAIAANGVRLPPLPEYFTTLYRYWLAHKAEPGYTAKA